MNKTFVALMATVLVVVSSLAAPISGFKYQAVVRNNQGAVIENSAVLLKISILQGTENGTSVYSEEHEVTTNAFGLVNVIIGNGTSPTGNFTDINWSGNPFYLKVEMAIAPNTTLELLGVSPLLAVPYALHAETVANNNDADANPENEIQDLNLSGSTLKITNNANATEINLAPFSGTNTDEQKLSVKGDSLSITNGNSVDLSSFKDNTDAQNLNLAGTTLAITGGNTVDLSTLPDQVNDADADPTNEIQSLSITADQLSLSGSNQVNLLPYKDNTDTQNLNLSGTTLTITGGNTVDLSTLPDLVNDADADPTNELQLLSIANDSLILSKGNKVGLPKQDVLWDNSGTTLFYNDGNVGIGTGSPKGKLEVKGSAVTNPDEIIFGVLNNAGDTVFAVYQSGVRINIADKGGKGTGSRGGFAVGGYSTGKGTLTNEYLRITPDSVRVYVNDDTTGTKGTGSRGGFAVGGYSTGKGLVTNEYLRVTPDSVRVYLDDSQKKGTGSRGGFAVGGFSTGKGDNANFFNISTDTTGIIDPSENRVLWYPLKNAFLVGRVLIESSDSVGENSMATGFESKAIGNYTQALGYKARAYGNNSTAMGNKANAVGHNSLALGNNAYAEDSLSYALGNFARTQKVGSYAIGSHAQALGISSFALGSVGINTDGSSTAPTIASGDYSYAFGMGSQATGKLSLSFGGTNLATKEYSIAMGRENKSEGTHSIAIGTGNTSTKNSSIALGWYNNATGPASFALGNYTNASGIFSTAIGNATRATGLNATTMGFETTANGDFSTAIGRKLWANGYGSLALGNFNTAEGETSIVMGNNSFASAINSIAIGLYNTASGASSLALGNYTSASGVFATTMGTSTKASGHSSTALGSGIEARGANTFGIGISMVTDVITDDNTMAIMGGEVGIGTVSPDKLLHVAGDARITGDIYYGTVGSTTTYTKPDFVFKETYTENFDPLQVESFINENGHLPWLTKAADEKEGVNMTRMQFETLETVENLQLQIIQQQSEIEGLKEKLSEFEILKVELAEIKSLLKK